MGNLFKGLSGKWNQHLVRNVVIAIGVVLVWRGVWHLADQYLFPDNYTLSSVVSLVIGIFLLYFVDGDLSPLGGVEDEEQHILKRNHIYIWNIVTIVIVFLSFIGYGYLFFSGKI